MLAIPTFPFAQRPTFADPKSKLVREPRLMVPYQKQVGNTKWNWQHPIMQLLATEFRGVYLWKDRGVGVNEFNGANPVSLSNISRVETGNGSGLKINANTSSAKLSSTPFSGYNPRAVLLFVASGYSFGSYQRLMVGNEAYHGIYSDSSGNRVSMAVTGGFDVSSIVPASSVSPIAFGTSTAMNYTSGIRYAAANGKLMTDTGSCYSNDGGNADLFLGYINTDGYSLGGAVVHMIIAGIHKVQNIVVAPMPPEMLLDWSKDPYSVLIPA